MISILEVLSTKPNRSSLAFRKPTRTKAKDEHSSKKVDTYRKISSKLVDKADIKGKPWGSKKMK